MRKICIFGAGKIGRGVAYACKYGGISFIFVDNDSTKQNSNYMNSTIYEPNILIGNNTDYFVVIACNTTYYIGIEKQLLKYGLKEEQDFVSAEFFMNNIVPKMIFEYSGKMFISLCQISLTERCTLKCKKCAHCCYAVPSSSKDLSLEQVYKTADNFFTHIDMINNFVLIGGEPLLYKNLEKVICYIGEKYRTKMRLFSITTNGTLLPSDDVIKMIKKYNVSFFISNYSRTLSWIKERHEKLIHVLSTNGISYTLGSEETQWMDYGFESLDRKASPDELKKVFHACRTPCHEVRKNRLYYCVMARAVSENLGFNVGNDDYLDLNNIHGEEGKRILLKFIQGEFDKGYLDMCNYCHGADSVKFPIPAAEQVAIENRSC